MQQHASALGIGNTVVQIVGDSNVVNASGSPCLTLTRFIARRKIRDDFDRLSPYTCSTRLVGRKDELDGLHAFLKTPHPLSVRVLIGGGGSGKTRLALELTEQAAVLGWSAGFVTRQELVRFRGQQNLSTWGWQHPTLIVVDYAAENADLLRDWIEELANRAQPPDRPLRMLLLERDANTDTGWWAVVFRSGGYGATTKRALLDPAEPVRIRPLVQVEDRLALLQAMLKARADIRLPMDDAAFKTKLMRLDWGGDPLFLMMAAMTMDEIGHAHALVLGRADLAKRLADREADRFVKLARERRLGTELVNHLVACVTLMQGMSRDEFERFAAAEKTAIRRPSEGDVAALADVLQEALPRVDGISPVLPDLIGEALIMGTLRNEVGTKAVLRCHANSGHVVTATVIRCAQDFAPQESTPLRWLDAIAAALHNDEAGLAALDSSLPTRSVVLRDFSLNVAERLHELRELRLKQEAVSDGERAVAHVNKMHRMLATQWPDMANDLGVQHVDVLQPERAATLNNQAGRLSELSQHERALDAALGAVDQYRKLAESHLDNFGPNLAKSLSNLADIFRELGQREPALRAAREAVYRYRKLASQGADSFRPELAVSLGNLADMYGELGRRKAALRAAQETVDVFRQLADQRPDEFRPRLTLRLATLATMLSELGQRKAALCAAEEAVDVCHKLANQAPDLLPPGLAVSLRVVVACMFNELGQREAALRAAEEAVDVYHKLADQTPGALQPDLVASLGTVVASMFSQMGQDEPALQVAQEVVNQYRELDALRSDEFRPDLAGSLKLVALMFHELGQREDALDAAQAGFKLYSKLAIDAFGPDLAASLGIVAIMQSELGQREDALDSAQEGVKLYRKLVAKRSGLFEPDLAGALNILAFMHSEQGQSEFARPAAEEAVYLYRQLDALRPAVFLPNLAASLNTLATTFSGAGQFKDALRAAQEAVELRRKLAAHRPETFRSHLAESLNNLARRLNELGQCEDALRAAREAVDVYRELVAQRPYKFRPDLADSLFVLALQTKAAGDTGSAASFGREAMATLLQDFKRRPNAHARLMRAMVRNYVQFCAAANQEPDQNLLDALLPYFTDKE